MPMRALNRRKLLVIKGSEKAGRLTYFEERRSFGGTSSSSSRLSSGTTCPSNLVKSLSWIESFAPSACSALRSCAFSLRCDGDTDLFSRLDRLAVDATDSASDAEVSISLFGTTSNGTGSSRLAKASAVYSSILLLRHLCFRCCLCLYSRADENK